MIRNAAVILVLSFTTPAAAEIGGVFRTAEPLGAGAARLTLSAQYGGGKDFDFGGAHALLTGAIAAFALGDRADVFVQGGYEFDDSVAFTKLGFQVAVGPAGRRVDLALRSYAYAFDLDAPGLAAVGATALVSARLDAATRLTPYAGLGFDAPLDGDGTPKLRDGDPDAVVLLGVRAPFRGGVALNIEGAYIGEPLIAAALSFTF